MNPAQKRTGSASASSHESQDVTPPSRVAAQLDNSTLLPAPADPTTTVRRWLAPASSRPSSVGLVSSVVGSVVGRNFASANRALCGTRSVTARCAPASPAVPIMAEAEATSRFIHAPGEWFFTAGVLSSSRNFIFAAQSAVKQALLPGSALPPCHPRGVVPNPEPGRRLLVHEQRFPIGEAIMTSTVTSRHGGVTRGEYEGGRGHGPVLG